jgi:hypothetical protein
MTKGQAMAARSRYASALSLMKQTGIRQAWTDGNGVQQWIEPAIVGVPTESAAMTAARIADAATNSIRFC